MLIVSLILQFNEDMELDGTGGIPIIVGVNIDESIWGDRTDEFCGVTFVTSGCAELLVEGTCWRTVTLLLELSVIPPEAEEVYTVLK